MGSNCFIYALYSKSECRVRYIGVSIDPKKRFKSHQYCSLNKNSNEYNLYKNKWLRSVDDAAMKIIFSGTEEDCYLLEKELIDKYKQSRALTNTSLGGDHPPRLNDLSIDKYNEVVGKIRQKSIGRKASEETRSKMSLAHKSISKPHLSGYHKGVNNPRARKVSQHLKTGELVRVWDYANQAVTELKLNRTAITDCIKGRQKSAGGFIWKVYTEDTEERIIKEYENELN